MVRCFAGAALWFVALWTVGAWMEAVVGLPEQFGLLAGLVVAGLLVGYGLRLGFAGQAPAPAPATATTD